MHKFAFKILRIGMAITFLWVGLMILKAPEAWSGYMDFWVLNLLSDYLKIAMLGTAFLDIVIGVLFLVEPLVFIAGGLASVHLAVILIVSGVNDITVRDIGLLAAALATFFFYFPFEKTKKVGNNFVKTKNVNENEMKNININKTALAGGLVFAILDVVCAVFVALALEPFIAFWSYVSHVRFVGLQMEGAVTLGSVIGGVVFFFALGYVLTWLFVRLCGKTCCNK